MEQAEEAFKPIRDFKTPAFELIGPMPHPVMQSMFDPIYPAGHQWYWKADFYRELSDEAIVQHMRYGPDLPTPQSTMHLYPINGAAHRVGKKDTPWSYREANWAEVIVGVDPTRPIMTSLCPGPGNTGKLCTRTRSAHLICKIILTRLFSQSLKFIFIKTLYNYSM